MFAFQQFFKSLMLRKIMMMLLFLKAGINGEYYYCDLVENIWLLRRIVIVIDIVIVTLLKNVAPQEEEGEESSLA